MNPYDKAYYEHIDNYERRSSRNKTVMSVVLSDNSKSMLDVGCGNGYFARKVMNRGLHVIGVDSSKHAGSAIPEMFVVADAKSLPFRDKAFDVVFSSDFYEHISEEDIPRVYEEMKRVGKRIVAVICLKKSEHHLTVKPRYWWKTMLPDAQIL